MGLAAWEKYPWFGVGKDNYGLITAGKVQSWRTQARKDFDPADYYPSSHGHSLFVTTLAERGAIGLGALLAMLLGALAALLSWRPRPEDANLAWLAWGAAASAWFVTVGVGTVNTTLHHEHGLLSALIIGLWLSTLRSNPRAS
jgi:O-antigen ligase